MGRRCLSIWYSFWSRLSFLFSNSHIAFFELKNGESRNETIKFGEDKSPEINYMFFQGTVDEGNMLSIEVEAAECHVDILARRDKFPDLENYEYSVINPPGHRNNSTLNISHPQKGKWYFAILSKMACNFNIKYYTKFSCPNDCGTHGTCDQGACICEPNYFLEDCSQQVLTLNSGEELSHEAKKDEFVYYLIQTNKQQLKVQVSITSSSRQTMARFLVKHGSPPTEVDFFKEINTIDGIGNFLLQQPQPGNWYIGVISTENVKYKLLATVDIKCPNDCSGNGQCDNGTCKCNEGYIMKDCSRYLKKVDSGLTFNEELSGHQWKFYRLSTRSMATNITLESSEDLSEIYIYSQKDKEPNFVEYLELKVCEKKSCSTIIYDGGGYVFFGIYNGMDQTSKFKLSFNLNLACKNNCFGRGVCVDGTCRCNVNYKGEDCSIAETVLLNSEKPIEGEVHSGEMKFYKLEIEHFTTLKFYITDIREGAVKLFLRPDKYPTLTEYAKSVISKHTKSEVTSRTSSDSTQGVWYLGVYGLSQSAKFKVSVIADTLCSNQCSNNGVCENGTCICFDGWTSVDCSSKLAVIDYNATLSGMVAFDNWHYFNLTVEEDIAMKVVVIEYNNQIHGVVWTFMSNGRVPRIDDSDHKNQTVSSVHTLHIPYNESKGLWTIGITGSPRSPLKYKSSSYRLSIHMGCTAYPSCVSCIEDPKCGWCRTDIFNTTIGKCVDGTEKGPDTNMCSLYSYTSCGLESEFKKSMSQGFFIGGGVSLALALGCITLAIILRLRGAKSTSAEDDIDTKEEVLIIHDDEEEEEDDSTIFESNVPIITHKYYGATISDEENIENTLTQSQIYHGNVQHSEKEDEST